MLENGLCFHRLTVDGVVFRAVLSAEGPYLSAWGEKLSGSAPLGAVYLAAGPRDITVGGADTSRDGWWIRVSPQDARIDLSGLSLESRGRVCAEFGVSLLDTTDKGRMFLASPAFRGLCDWAEKHPRMFKRYVTYQQHLPLWPDNVLEALRARKSPAGGPAAKPPFQGVAGCCAPDPYCIG